MSRVLKPESIMINPTIVPIMPRVKQSSLKNQPISALLVQLGTLIEPLHMLKDSLPQKIEQLMKIAYIT
jgi:hypothetical protein